MAKRRTGVEVTQEYVILHFKQILSDGRIECQADLWGELYVDGKPFKLNNTRVPVIFDPSTQARSKAVKPESEET